MMMVMVMVVVVTIGDGDGGDGGDGGADGGGGGDGGDGGSSRSGRCGSSRGLVRSLCGNSSIRTLVAAADVQVLATHHQLYSTHQTIFVLSAGSHLWLTHSSCERKSRPHS